jgi:hypothetical protein
LRDPRENAPQHAVVAKAAVLCARWPVQVARRAVLDVDHGLAVAFEHGRIDRRIGRVPRKDARLGDGRAAEIVQGDTQEYGQERTDDDRYRVAKEDKVGGAGKRRCGYFVVGRRV